MLVIVVACFLLFCFNVNASPREGSIVVFQKGEGQYYCHKIPYLLRTQKNVLIALAEGRGRKGREACDDFSVSVLGGLMSNSSTQSEPCFLVSTGNRSRFQAKRG